MTTLANGKPQSSGIFLSNDPEAFEAEYVSRMFVSAAGLPRICTVRRCRRRGRCFGPYDGDLPCMRRHPGLCRQRFPGALKVLGLSDLVIAKE